MMQTWTQVRGMPVIEAQWVKALNMEIGGVIVTLVLMQSLMGREIGLVAIHIKEMTTFIGPVLVKT